MTPEEHGYAVERLHRWALAITDATKVMLVIAALRMVLGIAECSASPPRSAIAACVIWFGLVVLNEVLLLVAAWHLRCIKRARESERRR